MSGTSAAADARSEIVRLATRLLLEEAGEAEARDAVGREYYRHGGCCRPDCFTSRFPSYFALT
jgi:hypothetical protein